MRFTVGEAGQPNSLAQGRQSAHVAVADVHLDSWWISIFYREPWTKITILQENHHILQGNPWETTKQMAGWCSIVRLVYQGMWFKNGWGTFQCACLLFLFWSLLFVLLVVTIINHHYYHQLLILYWPQIEHLYDEPFETTTNDGW